MGKKQKNNIEDYMKSVWKGMNRMNGCKLNTRKGVEGDVNYVTVMISDKREVVG